MFNERCQYTILSVLAHPAVWSARPRVNLALLSFRHFPPKASAMAWFLSLFMTYMTPMSQVLSDMGCRPL